MTDDKPGGDDLFEDLDKFFAPIRDVDWGSEETSTTSESPQEEHVAVRPSEADPIVIAEEPETTVAPGSAIEDEDDDGSWYDTSVLEPIDELMGEAIEDEDIETDVGSDVEGPARSTDQGGLFDGPEASDEGSVNDDETPSAEDIEAAAEHFSGSIHADDGLDDEPVDEVVTVVGDEPASAGGDLFADIHGGDVEDDILSDLDGDDGAPRTVVVGAEGLGGPSWQEPTSVEVGADLDRRGPNEGERDMPAAFLTGIVLAGVALGSLMIGKGAFAIVAAIVVLVAQGELFGVTVKQHQQPATAVGLVAGALMIAGAYYHGEAGVLAMFALGVITTLVWFIAAPAAHRKGAILQIGVTVMNIAYIPLLASYLIVTLAIGGSDGKSLVVAVIGLTFIYDTAAFLVGSVWGGSFFQRPLAPSVSPKKSLEGLIGATLITIIVAMALVPSFVGPFEEKRMESLMLALVVAAAATLGDLAESLIKRDLGIKDMGSILPGHGGVLDRIDSLLFVAPAAFLLFRVIFA
ncbi:MAG: phosphatidate cytidylyltransferase [Actinomycetota bacterium]